MKKVDKEGISVVIPTFNRSKYLYATLICLCNQKLKENVKYEIIVVDSGDDDTEKIVKYFQSICKVKIIYKKIKKCRNRSLVRNKGAELSNYNILCFLDNDMLTPPDFIQTHFIKHQEKEKLVLLGCRKSLINFDINQIGEETLQNHFEILEELPYYTDERLKLFNQNAPWRFVFSHTMSVRKDDFYKAGKFNVDFGEHWGFEDLELGFNLELLGCHIELITDQFTFHQPHFSQSNKEQHEESSNGKLFLKLHNCFEVELCEYFYTSFDEYYQRLKSLKKTFKLPSKKILNKYELILACLFTSNERKKLKQMQLGTSCIQKNNSLKNVYIHNTWFDFPDIVKMGILSEAFRITQKVYFENINSNQITQIEHFIKKIGIKVKFNLNNDIAEFIKLEEKKSDFFIILLPTELQPEKRFVYIWLGKWLLENNYFVNFQDIKMTKEVINEDFSLETKDLKYINDNINKSFGKIISNFINPLAMVLDGICLKSLNPFKTFIFHDQDFNLKNKNIILNKIQGVHFNEDFFSLISFMSVYNICKEVKETNTKMNQFCCFMENGFLEDGIDIILETFFEYLKENIKAKLVIKLPNYNTLCSNAFPMHNNMSKENKLFSIKQKILNDRHLLNEKIRNLSLEDNIILIEKNLNIKSITELVANSDSLIHAGRGCIVSPQVYMAIQMNKNVIIAKHHLLHKDLKNYCNIINSTKNDVYKELNIPASCMNIMYIANRIEKNDLLAGMKLSCKKMDKNTMDLFYENGINHIKTYVVG